MAEQTKDSGQKIMLTNLEKKVISVIQGDIPITQSPYRDMAKGMGITEEEFLATLRDLDQRGLIRRFGATLKHQKSGFTANAMVAWNVPENRVETVGGIMAKFPQVSHCYRRNPVPGWEYNMYTMVHAKTREQCREFVREISRSVNETDYAVLFSVQELKKTSMVYFAEEH